jgi:hypothetical protein
MNLSGPSRRERHVLNEWITLRDRGFAYLLRRRTGLFLFWFACFFPGMLLSGPARPYIVGMAIGFAMNNVMRLRATHAFWPIMQRFIDWQGSRFRERPVL